MTNQPIQKFAIKLLCNFPIRAYQLFMIMIELMFRTDSICDPRTWLGFALDFFRTSNPTNQIAQLLLGTIWNRLEHKIQVETCLRCAAFGVRSKTGFGRWNGGAWNGVGSGLEVGGSTNSKPKNEPKPNQNQLPYFPPLHSIIPLHWNMN